MPAKIILSKEIQTALRHEFYGDLTVTRVMSKYSLSYKVVARHWRQWFNENLRKQRTSRLLAIGKLGDKNPMYGKCGREHPRFVPLTYVQGYACIPTPGWYTGSSDRGRVYQHIAVWCACNGVTKLPKKCVVHHLDHTKTNNSPDNLLLMTMSAHMKYHCAYRRGDIERATTILERSRAQESSKRSPS